MMLLQETSDLLNQVTSTEPFKILGFSLLQIEKAVIFVIILIQIYRTYRVSSNISQLKKIFNFPLEVKTGYLKREFLLNKNATTENIIFKGDEGENIKNLAKDDNYVKITIIKSSSSNEILKRIENTINSYLINNYGANVNFSIIKDIIDREIDAKDEEINQSIPTPLYLGLAATMLGIIFGLISMPNIEGDNFIKAINVLIDGVKLAMIASLVGLILTTVLSSHTYKNARKKILQEKNDLLSNLQTQLLPELIKAEDTGVSGLKASLDRFAREATSIVDGVNISVLNSGQNIKLQQAVLDKVEKLNVTKVTKASLELFDRLDANMTAFNTFSKNVAIIADISNNLKAFANRTGSIDLLANQINSSLQESQKLSRFLTTHFEKIESSGQQALKAVNYSDSHFKDAIEKLTLEIDERIAKMNKNANVHESQIKEVYDAIGKKLDKITSQHLNQFKTAYLEAVPKFEQLDHLEILQPIKEVLDENFEIEKTTSSALASQVTLIKDVLDKNANKPQNNIKLENAILELSKSILGKDFKAPNDEAIEKSKNSLINKIEIGLRFGAWSIIIVIGTYIILSHFNVF